MLGSDGPLLITPFSPGMSMSGEPSYGMSRVAMPSSTSVVNFSTVLPRPSTTMVSDCANSDQASAKRLPLANSSGVFPNPISSRYFNVSLLKFTAS